MAPENLGTWRLLPQQGTLIRRVPLYCKFFSSSTGFKLLVTDLSQLWSQTQSSHQISRQASSSETCGIDPSEDPSQYDVLLEKLQLALSGQGRGSNLVQKDVEHDGKRLKIISSIPLPEPLDPLTWIFNLEESEDELGLTQEILIPALEATAARDEHIKSLRQHLADKDHVISRLMDKIEGSGFDLSVVFPGLTKTKSSKRKVSGDQAAKLVAGLAPFDDREWENEQRRDELGGGSTADGLLEAIKSSTSARELAFREGSAAYDSMSRHAARKKRKSSELSSSNGSSIETEDDLPSKKSPPNKPRHERSKSLSSTSTATASGPEDSQTSISLSKPQQKKSPVSPKLNSKPKRRSISSASSSSPEPQTSAKPSKPTNPPKKLRSSSISSTSSSTASNPSPPPKPPPSTNLPPRKLGAIGKRNHPKPRQITKSPDIPPPPSTATTTATTPRKRLGQIGKRNNSNNNQSTPSSTPTKSQRTPLDAASPTWRLHSHPHPHSHSASASASDSDSDAPPARKRTSKAKTQKPKPKPETEEEKIARKRSEVERIERGAARKRGRRF